MEVVSYQSSNLRRQAEEADQILRHGGEGFNLRNRKGEWGQNLAPKLSVEDQVEDIELKKRKVEVQGIGLEDNGTKT